MVKHVQDGEEMVAIDNVRLVHEHPGGHVDRLEVQLPLGLKRVGLLALGEAPQWLCDSHILGILQVKSGELEVAKGQIEALQAGSALAGQDVVC